MGLSISVSKQPGTWVLGLLAVVMLAALACGASAVPTQQPTAPPVSTPLPFQEPTSAPSDSPAATVMPRPTAAPAPAVAPAEDAKDSLVFVVDDEPVYADMICNACGGTTAPYYFMDNISDTLVWVDNETLQLVPMSGAERWEQVAPDRWRFFLRKGVKFHNGEVWNAQSAKYSLDITGKLESDHSAARYAGELSGEVVDDYTLDLACVTPCPVLDRGGQFFRFEAPEKHLATSEEERHEKPTGIGPFSFVEWRQGEFWEIERYDDYVPAPGVADAQKSTIRSVKAVWRGESAVRAAMVEAGEADLAYDVGPENRTSVPVAKPGGAAEVIAYTIDTLWHPALKKVKVRQALNYAVDCEAMVAAIWEGLSTCRGNIAMPGTLGITEENSVPYPYDPDKARQLLIEAGYAGEEIRLYGRAARIPKAPEFYEAVVNYWREVGINAEVRVTESSRRREISRTGCGRTAEPLRCAELGPGEPTFDSSHVYDNAISGETMDWGRQAIGYMNCFWPGGHWCDPERSQPMLEKALAASGEERKQLMEQLAAIYHDEAGQVFLFDYIVVWGLSDALQWEPRWDRRVRFNNMRFGS